MENENPIDIGFLILLGCLGMTILAVSIILFVVLYQKKILAQQNQIQAAENRHQKELLNATIEVAEQEREKIAKNIHDDIGTLLNVIKLHLTKISRNAHDKVLSEELIRESMNMLDESIQNIRGISQDLMPPTLIKLGFEKGISELCRQINSSGLIAIEHTRNSSEIRLPGKTELQLYRIIQEVINNVIKHTRATQVNISSQSDPNGVAINITHNGIGITSEMISRLTQTEQGIGLKSIQSRAQLINASIQYLTIGSNQAEVSIEVPFPDYEKTN